MQTFKITHTVYFNTLTDKYQTYQSRIMDDVDYMVFICEHEQELAVDLPDPEHIRGVCHNMGIARSDLSSALKREKK